MFSGCFVRCGGSDFDPKFVVVVVMTAEPNNDSPLNSYAAALWNNQEGECRPLF